MRSYVDRRNMIENLITLLQSMEKEMEPAVSLRIETELLIAYSLVQIEQHLSDIKSGGRALAP
ncbi:MAG: hypothetical protein ACREID_01505 [Planctomycetota bacterium]